ncbi:hypothetical protein M9H77_16329 [Catharanthus roseus]|uniref:Uncharacterized protein n=1 Tax=Catharanthus roseus TaxID=4058 RepID=A0ACC0B1G8_CATRO|nr:hypothetical protein M9H77_16329 [Catharanthus roseus]
MILELEWFRIESRIFVNKFWIFKREGEQIYLSDGDVQLLNNSVLQQDGQRDVKVQELDDQFFHQNLLTIQCPNKVDKVKETYKYPMHLGSCQQPGQNIKISSKEGWRYGVTLSQPSRSTRKTIGRAVNENRKRKVRKYIHTQA